MYVTIVLVCLYKHERDLPSMSFTVAELALAVSKSETYVRQHILRKHLKALRHGRSVTVSQDEAVRWARERGLHLVIPARVSVMAGDAGDRTARMVVLSFHPSGGQPFNLFTHIRHRRKEGLGPWAREAEESWTTRLIQTGGGGVAEELRLHTIDAPLQYCRELVDLILGNGVLEIDDISVRYTLSSEPRRHWAFRDERADADPSVSSPFSRHSAEIIEYWSLEREPEERWLDVMESFRDELPSSLARLRFPLDRRSERAGNLMISRAEDAIDCDLSAMQNKTLVLSVDGDELQHDAYSATVWASHSGDEVVRQQMPITKGETVIDLQSDVDRYGFAIYQNIDGQCIDSWDVYRMMQISLAMNIGGGPTLHLRDRKSSKANQISPWNSRSTTTIELDKDSALLDKEIRRLVLGRRARQRADAARKEDGFERFGPDQLDDAVDYFISLLSRHSYQADPIYVADPYFLRLKPEETEKRLFLGMVEAIAGRQLRILCGPPVKERPWWTDYPPMLTSRIAIRAFVTGRGGKRALHDRYLVAGETEVVMTNSFNGWSTGGSYVLQTSVRRI